MTKTIVTGVDSSQTALKAAEKAAELADNYGGTLHICTAFSTSSTDALSSIRSRSSGRTNSSEYKKLIAGVSAAAEQIAESVAAILREVHPGLTIEVSSVPGNPADALLKKAKEQDADLIVVGNKRLQGVSRILGSVARKVSAEAPCDLYIAHTKLS